MYFCPLCTRVYARPGVCADDGSTLEKSGEASKKDPVADELVGQKIGSYRIERLIGRGGMGEVYLGMQPDIGSRVAIKVLAATQRPGSALVDRFFAEARAVNLIRHEGLVNILDLGKMADGRPYIVMEYLEGAPLSLHIASGPFPLGTLARLMGELLDALAAAHATGITHRDLKPDNVFITTLGRVKVLDFGIAKLKPELMGQTPETQAGSLLGTPHYMSPEQARGLPADHRSDLYSVGVMLFECATGRRPFDADSLYELLHHHITSIPPPAASLRPDLPPPFGALIARALEKEPARRFQSAAELADALDDTSRFLPQDSFVPLSKVPRRSVSLRPGATLDATATGKGASLASTAVAPAAKKATSLVIGLLLGTFVVALVAVIGVVALVVVWRGPKRLFRAKQIPRTEVAPPYDPNRFDMNAYLPVARKKARHEYPDAKLVLMSGTNVASDGTSALAIDKPVSFVFRSPSRSAKSTAGEQGDCIVNIVVTPRDVYTVRSASSCNTQFLLEPRCSVREVVKRAGLLPGVRGRVNLIGVGGKNVWMVWRSTRDAETRVDDDC